MNLIKNILKGDKLLLLKGEEVVADENFNIGDKGILSVSSLKGREWSTFIIPEKHIRKQY